MFKCSLNVKKKTTWPSLFWGNKQRTLSSGVTMRAADPGSAVAVADDAVTAPKELRDRFN